MPTHDYMTFNTIQPDEGFPVDRLVDLQRKRWAVSPRVKGKLILRANAYSYRKQTWTFPKKSTGTLMSVGYNAGGSLRSEFAAQVDSLLRGNYNAAYSKLRGRLYAGNAGLGVGLASVGQSRQMIVKRFQQLEAKVDSSVLKLTRTSPRHMAKAVASTHLEIIFGWTPLLADIHAAATSVIQQADVYEFVTGAHQSSDRMGYMGDGPPFAVFVNGSISTSTRISTKVKVINPNRWLQERAGLLNPVAVAWDVVPWSFVVNMFVNTGSLVNSITDFAGLQFTDGSITDTARIKKTTFAKPVPDPKKQSGQCDTAEIWKDRRLFTVPPPPTLEFKIPKASWELAAMAASLFVQKFVKLSRLL